MTVEVWPFDSLPEMRSFRLRAFNVSAIGSQTREVFAGGLIVQRFEVKMSMPDMNEDKWREHDGLIARLRGIGGFIRLWDAARPEPYYNQAVTRTQEFWSGPTTWTDETGFASGPLPPFVAVRTAAVRGDSSVVLQNFPASKLAVLRPGDLFEIRPNGQWVEHGHLYLVTRTANSDANGYARVYFEPGLRTGVAAGDQVVLGDGKSVFPSSVFRLSSDEDGLIDVRSPNIGSLGISFIEVLPRA